MKVQFEDGDVVDVADDLRAGKAAACTVELIKEIRKGVWSASIIDGQDEETPDCTVQIEYLIP